MQLWQWLTVLPPATVLWLYDVVPASDTVLAERTVLYWYWVWVWTRVITRT